MAGQPMKVSILIGVDATGAKAGGAAAEVALDAVTTTANEAGAALDKVATEAQATGTAINAVSTSATAAGTAIGRMVTATAGVGKATAAFVTMRAAANDVGSEINRLIAQSTGLDRALSTSGRGDDIAAYGAQLDALRSKYNPLYATVQRYRAEVQGIRDAHRLGALSSSEMAAAISRERQATLASIDAIKGRNAAIRAMPAANNNSNIGAFQTSNIAAQFQDIGVTAAMGMSPLQIALQQGTQLSAVFADMKNPVLGIGAALASVFSPVSLVTIGVVGLTAAAVQYGAAFLASGRDSEETLRRQKDLIAEVAQAWGDTMPALKAYFDGLKTAEEAQKRQEATAAAIEMTWSGARSEVEQLKVPVADAVKRLSSMGTDGQKAAAIAEQAFFNLSKRVGENKATFEDVRNAQTTMALAFNQEGLVAVDGLAAAFARLMTIVDAASGRTRALVGDSTNELALWEERLSKGKSYTEALLKLQQAYRDQYNPVNIPAGVEIPTPEPRPNLLDYDPNEEQTRKLEAARQEAAQKLEQQRKSYQDFILTQGQSIERLQLEIQMSNASVAERQRAIAMLDTERKIRELGLQTSSREAELIRMKAAEQARLQQVVNGNRVLLGQQDDIARLQLEISLVGQSAEVRQRSIAAFEAERQIRDQGIASISREADAIRANAQVRAELQLQLERQQAAYGAVQQAGSTMIDQLVVGTGSLRDRLKSMAETLLTTFQQLAIANPLKNQLLGTNLPTLGDLFSGRSASPIGTTTTAAMTVTAGTVMINGTPIGTPVSQMLGATNSNIPAAANQNPALAGLVNDPSLASRTIGSMDPATRTGLYRQAISQIESGSYSGNYNAIGNVTSSGDRAYGRYQVMGNNIGPWTEQHYGQRLTSEQFLANQKAQDAVFDGEFGSYVSKYGEGPAATKWFTGSHIARGRQDVNGMSDTRYQSQFEGNMQKLSQTTASASNNVSTLGTGAIDAGKALTSGSQSITGSVTQLSTATAQVPAQSQGLFSSLFSTLGKGVQSVGSGVGGVFSSIFGGLFANGAAFSGGNVIPFAAGGVVTKPTLFPMAGGRMGMMGEAGEEAIMPLSRGPGGRLGVSMAMPRQMRQGGGQLRMDFRHESTIVVTGNGDKELREQLRAGYQEELDARDRRIRASFPAMLEEYQQNPWARQTG